MKIKNLDKIKEQALNDFKMKNIKLEEVIFIDE